MLESIAAAIAAALKNAGINAVSAYESEPLCEKEPTVSIALDSARISSAGLGNYIGICTENGDVKEMYGDRAEISVKAEVYCPPVPEYNCTEAAESFVEQLRLTDELSVLSFEIGQVSHDEQSRMLRCACTARCRAYLVRRKLSRGLSAYGLGESK